MASPAAAQDFSVLSDLHAEAGVERRVPGPGVPRVLVAGATGYLGGFVARELANFVQATAGFLLLLFVMLYAMFFFLRDGRKMLGRILYVTPLSSEDEYRLVERFASVSRATLKGTLVIGAVQGGLVGIAFAVVGIGGAAFWGTLMAVLSIIPGLGTALVWVPAVIILAAGGNFVKAGGLCLFCALVVGSIDNLLRPVLVGKDTQMHELMIFFGTLGGIIMFGVMGMIIGPIVAALFVTIWEIYGVAFKDILPKVGTAPTTILANKDQSPEDQADLNISE